MSTFALQDEDLCQALRRRVKHYKKDHPALSSQQIAKRFKMSSSTLNRIENEDIRNPTIDQVLKVLRGTGETNDLLSFIEEYYPDIAETYREVYSENLNSSFIEVSHESYFKDRSTFTIMLLAYTGEGTSKDEVLSLLGQSGLRELVGLIQKEILSESKEGKISAMKGQKVNMSQEAFRSLLMNSIDTHYKVDNFGTGRNFLSFQTSSLSKEIAMPKINAVLKEAFSKVQMIIDDPVNNGLDKVFIGLTADTFYEVKKGS
ncbi:MAG: transcriptional regulator with XRE-family HTH domain [Bacteriovoracaceae bacterium]|jgi:transcriptional regulator with XRE-family HTH domain